MNYDWWQCVFNFQISLLNYWVTLQNNSPVTFVLFIYNECDSINTNRQFLIVIYSFIFISIFYLFWEWIKLHSKQSHSVIMTKVIFHLGRTATICFNKDKHNLWSSFLHWLDFVSSFIYWVIFMKLTLVWHKANCVEDQTYFSSTYLLKLSAKIGCDARSIFKQSKAGLNSKFTFS